MKKIIGISIITTSLLANLAMAETATTTNTTITKPAIKVEINKDTKTNKAKDIEYVIELKEGWNLLGMAGYKPYVLNDLFGNKDLVGKVFVYNAEEQAWQSFVNEGNDTTVKTVVPGMGYWIEAKQAFSISFKSNIPSQKGVYEKLAINVPQEVADANNTDVIYNPLTGTPVTVSTVTYDEAFNDDGTIKDDFVTKDGSMDWNNLDLSNYSQDSWDDEFTFDIDLIDGAEFTDQVARAYRFSPLNERGGKVSIIENDKQIDGKFLIGHKGELEIQLKKKSNRAIDRKSDNSNNSNNNAKVNVNSNAGAPVTIRFDLIEIVESDTEVVLKLKNLDTKEPSKWTLTKVYDEVDDTWVDAKEFLMNSISDSDVTLTDEEWNSLSSDDSNLSTLLSSGDVESYTDEELLTTIDTTEISDMTDDASEISAEIEDDNNGTMTIDDMLNEEEELEKETVDTEAMSSAEEAIYDAEKSIVEDFPSR